MSGTEWTDAQKHAINTAGRTLIVSAAAGSGKTAVLVERIINKISGKNGRMCDVRRLMVVTFTNAAAAEMRAKISAAVSAELSRDYKNKALRRQLALIPSAHIETVHAFCLNLIKENFSLLGINPDFRIGDSAELEILKQKALDITLEEFYSPAHDGFSELCEALTDGRDDKRLCRTVMEIYEKIRSHPMPDRFIAQIKDNYEFAPGKRLSDTLWGEYLISVMKDKLNCAERALDSAAQLISGAGELEKAYMPAFERDLSDVRKLLDFAAAGEWDKAYDFCRNHKFERLGGVKKFEDKALLDRIKSLREVWKDIFADICGSVLTCTEAEALEDIRRSGWIAGALFDVIAELDRKYAELKAKRNLADFSDLEHMAVRLLTYADDDGNIQKSELACRLADNFDEIMVDEYQDTNAAQDMIFWALSKDGSNLFMVGDVKQSIYKFRMASPEIFIEKYTEYDDIEQAEEGSPTSISMNKNFRSRRQVTDTVNFIFKNTMSRELGDLDYTDREYLNPGAIYENVDDHAYDSELYILERGKKRGDYDDDDGEREEEEISSAQREAEFAAKRIRGLIDGGFKVTDKHSGRLREVRADDFAILLRSVSKKAEIYKKSLEAEGINCSAEQSGEFLKTEEIMTVTAMLRIIDGISREESLVGAMRSVIYGFSATELALIRQEFPDVPFYQALLNYAQKLPQSKCADFLRDIDRYRQYAADLTVSQLVWRLYEDKGLHAVFSAQKNGSRRAANLNAFYEYSKRFDRASLGLSGFVKIIERIWQNNESIQLDAAQLGGGVKIMSIHKSKGLEFPVVIVPDCAKRFNSDDIKKSALFHDKMGLGIKLRDGSGHFEHTTVIRNAVAEKIRAEAVSEELRVLYVALTRAKEKLIMTMSLPSAQSSVLKWAEAAYDGRFDAQMLKTRSNPAMWVAAPFLFHKSGDKLRELLHGGQSFVIKEDFPMTVEIIDGRDRQDGQTEQTQDIGCGYERDASEQMHKEQREHCFLQDCEPGTQADEMREAIIKKLNYEYKFKAETRALSKITPTMAKGRFCDGESAEDTAPIMPRGLKKPDFDGAGLSAADRGTAHHLAMQFVDFEKCVDSDGIKAEIDRLALNRIISSEQAAAIDTGALEGFFKSDIAGRMRKSGNVMREFKFSILCPADRFYSGIKSCDEVLLQGVVDCAFEEDGQLVIIDFKSDRVNAGYEAQAAEKYKDQVNAYVYAMTQVTGKQVKQSVLYFFNTGRAVEIKNDKVGGNI